MNQQKGYSLIEVLVSLMLVSTVALALLEQQWQIRHLLNQLVLRAGASQFLDQIDERLVVTANATQPVPYPYHLSLKRWSQGSIVQLDWSAAYSSITRQYRQIGRLK